MTNNLIAWAPTHLGQCTQNFAATVLLPQTGVLGISSLGAGVRPTVASEARFLPSYVMADVVAFAGPDTRVRIAKHSRPPRREPAE